MTTPSRSDLRDALAYVYRREGGAPIPAEELGNRVSFDLRWFSPGEARAFVERVRAADLVEETPDGLAPAFDPDAVDLPVSFTPDLDLDPVEETVAPEPGEGDGGGANPDGADGDPPAGGAGEGDLVGRVAEALAEATEWTRAEAEREIAAERDRLGGLVTDEAAALMLARNRGLEIDPWLEEASSRVRDRAREG